MSVLITGGLGYVGSHTAIALLRKGYDILIVDNLQNSSLRVLHALRELAGKNIHFVNADLTDPTETNRVFSENWISAVLHFAGNTNQVEAKRVPLMYYETNMRATINILEAMRVHDVKTFVFSSSAMVYKTLPPGELADENGELDPSDPYPGVKAQVERMCIDYTKADSTWRMAMLRYFRAAGADSSGLLGEKAPSQTGLFAALQQVASGQRESINVYGDDFKTRDGTTEREYTHVSDVADGHVATLEFLRRTNRSYSVHNLGTGVGSTIMEVVKAYEAAAGKEIKCTVVGRALREDADSRVCDVALARKELHWSARRSLHEMCRDSWRWTQRLGLRPRVLCTGGCGYVGSHTALDLLRQGYDVTLLDDLSNSNEKVKGRLEEIAGRSCELVICDLKDREKLDKVFFDGQFGAVLHFAAFKSPGESVRLPWKYYYNNVLATLTLLETMKKYNVKRFVFSSSATVYAVAEGLIKEDFALGPINPYGESKLMTEEICVDLAKSDPTWRISMLRYFNPVGADASGRIGEAPGGIPNNLLPFIQQVAIGQREKLTVFGDDYETKDGTGERDYIHVSDLAAGHVKALEYLSHTEQAYSVFNLGTGTGYSVLEMIKAYERISGKSIPYEIGARRPGDQAKVICDPSLAQKELGWKAEKNLDDVIAASWKWISNNPRGYES